MNKKVFMLGNDAMAEGAIAAGCRFYAGYPITPSSEIAERFSWRMLEVDGVFIQMEDELSSVSAIVGASLAGKKALTATSGPGFCLMQENLGCATMMEAPIVIVDVQRPGPSGGLATVTAQGDLMQARYGRNGDSEIIVISPASVQECYDYMIEAFNLSEKYRVPVIFLSDEATGHLKENMVMYDVDPSKIVNRKQPNCSPEEFGIFKPGEDKVPYLPYYGGEYMYDVTSTSHDYYGNTSPSHENYGKLVRRLVDKLEDNIDDIAMANEYYEGDLDVLIITYGCSTRPCREAAKRYKDANVGVLQLVTLSPLPKKIIEKAVNKAKHVLVAELNFGQLAMDIERLFSSADVNRLCKADGTSFTPSEVIDRIKEVNK